PRRFAIKSSRVFFVEASVPKNFARMSLSIPSTCAPSLAKRRTVSEPTNPAEPVTMIVRIILQSSKSHRRQMDLLARRDIGGPPPAHARLAADFSMRRQETKSAVRD